MVTQCDDGYRWRYSVDPKSGPTFGIDSDASSLGWSIVRGEKPDPLFRTML
jgi:hypothetical protein